MGVFWLSPVLSAEGRGNPAAGVKFFDGGVAQRPDSAQKLKDFHDPKSFCLWDLRNVFCED
jgi:hypothetical protein